MLLAECPLTLPSPEGEGLQVTPVPLQGGTNFMARFEKPKDVRRSKQFSIIPRIIENRGSALLLHF